MDLTIGAVPNISFSFFYCFSFSASLPLSLSPHGLSNSAARHLYLVPQESKIEHSKSTTPQDASDFQTSACVMFARVPLAKAQN